MASLPDSNYASTKTYNDGEILDEIDLDNTNTYLQNFINARKNDLVKVANDAFGEDYVLDGAATPLYANTLFEKQNTQGFVDLGADISIGTSADASFSNVNAGVAVVTLTPERAGTYRISFDFTHLITVNTALNAQVSTAFRFTDGGVLTSPVAVSGILSQTYARAWHPVHLELVTELEVAPYSFFLQKRNITADNAAQNSVCATATSGQINFSMEKV